MSRPPPRSVLGVVSPLGFSYPSVSELAVLTWTDVNPNATQRVFMGHLPFFNGFVQLYHTLVSWIPFLSSMYQNTLFLPARSFLYLNYRLLKG